MRAYYIFPKQIRIHIPKCPIACLNLIYNLCTCLNLFIQDHCESNKIFTDEQAVG